MFTSCSWALIAFCGPIGAKANADSIMLEVIDHDSSKRVESDIVRNEEDPPIAKTTEGIWEFSRSECGANSDRIRAYPVDINYLSSVDIYCRDLEAMTTLTVTRQEVVANLREWSANGDEREALAAEHDLRGTLDGIDDRGAVLAELSVYQRVGTLLQVDEPVLFDPLQNKEVLSPELEDALIEYQKDNDLKPDGVPGTHTIRELSGLTSADVRYGKPPSMTRD